MSKINSIIASLENEKKKLNNDANKLQKKRKLDNMNTNQVGHLSKNIENVSKAINCLKKITSPSMKNNNKKINNNILTYNKNNNYIQLKKQTIIGNGSCFYSSIGIQLNPSKTGEEVKNEIKVYVEKYSKKNNKNKLINNIQTRIPDNYNNYNNNNYKKQMPLVTATSIYDSIQNILKNLAIYLAHEDSRFRKGIRYDKGGSIIVNNSAPIIINDLGKWGGVHMLPLISTIYNVSIIVYNNHNKAKNFTEYKSDTVTSNDKIFIFYNGINHYDALIPIKNNINY
jgi:hypothetical protein